MVTLRNKVVLITGAARGIGATTARELAARGAKVILVDVDAEPLHQLADELGPKAAVSVVADVTDLPAMHDAVDTGVATFGGIDVVVANAGIASYGSVLHVDPAAFRRVIDINLTGVFHTVRAALPHVISRQGYVLVVSSMAAYLAGTGMASYGASKAGVEHFANVLRLEVAHQGVAVGSAHMTWIDTPLVRDARKDLATFDETIESLPGPLSKTLTVEECARAFVDGIQRRKRHVYVPAWIALVAWLKPVLTSAWADRRALATVAGEVVRADEEVAALGRATSARNLATGAVPTTSDDPAPKS